MRIREQAKREQLIRDGFCIFENVLDAATVAKLNAMSEWTISAGGSRALPAASCAGLHHPLLEVPPSGVRRAARRPARAGRVRGHGVRAAAGVERVRDQQAAARSAALLAPGRGAVGPSDQLHRPAAAVLPDVLPGRHQPRQRLSAGDPGLAPEASSAARPAAPGARVGRPWAPPPTWSTRPCSRRPARWTCRCAPGTWW